MGNEQLFTIFIHMISGTTFNICDVSIDEYIQVLSSLDNPKVDSITINHEWFNKSSIALVCKREKEESKNECPSKFPSDVGQKENHEAVPSCC